MKTIEHAPSYAYQLTYPIVFWTELNSDGSPYPDTCAGERVKMPTGTIVSVCAKGLQDSSRVLCKALDHTRFVYAWATLSELNRVL